MIIFFFLFRPIQNNIGYTSLLSRFSVLFQSRPFSSCYFSDIIRFDVSSFLPVAGTYFLYSESPLAQNVRPSVTCCADDMLCSARAGVTHRRSRPMAAFFRRWPKRRRLILKHLKKLWTDEQFQELLIAACELADTIELEPKFEEVQIRKRKRNFNTK